MEAGFIALVAFMAVIGVVAGMLIERRKAHKADIQDTIYVYYADSESKPSLLLDYNVPIDDIVSRKQVVFDINVIK